MEKLGRTPCMKGKERLDQGANPGLLNSRRVRCHYATSRQVEDSSAPTGLLSYSWCASDNDTLLLHCVIPLLRIEWAECLSKSIF